MTNDTGYPLKFRPPLLADFRIYPTGSFEWPVHKVIVCTSLFNNRMTEPSVFRERKNTGVPVNAFA